MPDDAPPDAGLATFARVIIGFLFAELMMFLMFFPGVRLYASVIAPRVMDEGTGMSDMPLGELPYAVLTVLIVPCCIAVAILAVLGQRTPFGMLWPRTSTLLALAITFAMSFRSVYLSAGSMAQVSTSTIVHFVVGFAVAAGVFFGVRAAVPLDPKYMEPETFDV